MRQVEWSGRNYALGRDPVLELIQAEEANIRRTAAASLSRTRKIRIGRVGDEWLIEECMTPDSSGWPWDEYSRWHQPRPVSTNNFVRIYGDHSIGKKRRQRPHLPREI